MTERDLDREIGDALRHRADAFTPDQDRAAERVLGHHARPQRTWAVGLAAALVVVLAGASWWVLADRRDTVDVVTPDPERSTSTTVPEPAGDDPRDPPALVVLSPLRIDDTRGHVALVGAGSPVSEDLGAEGSVALSPDGSHLVYRRATGRRDQPQDLVVRRLRDGHEEVVAGGRCPRFSTGGRLATVVSDVERGGTRLTAYEADLTDLFSFHTVDDLYCAEWDEGGDRLVAVGRDADERLVVWTIEVGGEASGGPVEGLHAASHVMLGPPVARGRFLVVAPSQHPPVSRVEDRSELGELVVEAGGPARYERIAELAAVPDWSHPDRTLLSPWNPVPLGLARAEVREDGSLVLVRSDAPSYLLADGLEGNLFAVDATGEVRYLATGVGYVATPPGGVHDEHLGVPLTWPDWVARAAAMEPSPCEGPDAVEADVTGDGRPDQVFHSWLGDFGMAVLGVCTADGTVDSVAGRGQTEIGGIIELGPDGWSVLTAGGTSVSWGGFQVGVVVEGRIRWVDLDGDALALWSGHQGVADDGAEGLAERGGAYGCEDLTGDGVLELVQVEMERTGDGTTVRWEKRGYRIDGTRASLVSTDSGTVAATDYLWDAAYELVGQCLHTR